MKEPTPKYRFFTNYEKREFCVINGKDEAVEFARNYIEADGNHIFAKMRINHEGAILLQWMEWIDEVPKMVSKTLGLYNADEFKKYEQWLRKEEAKAEKERMKAIHEKAKADNEKLKAELRAERVKKNLAIKWIEED